MKNKKSQVWVETVVYTLIALIMIGAAIGFVRPKLKDMQDKAVIEQTLEIMRFIDAEKITSAAEGATGNQRTFEVIIKKGILKIDGSADKIIFEIDESSHTFSEPGQDVKIGNIIARTEKIGKLNKVTLTLDYSDKYDLKYKNEDIVKSITKSTSLYKISVLNNGYENNKKEINLEVVG